MIKDFTKVFKTLLAASVSLRTVEERPHSFTYGDINESVIR